MDINERIGDEQLALRELVDRKTSRIWSLLPVKVTKVDLATNTVHAQPQIKYRAQERDPATGELRIVDKSMPELQDLPIKFYGGGGFTFTVPIKVGDEGTVHFSSRCIDNWWADGGEQPQVTENGRGSTRQNDLSDGFFQPGGRSKPNAIANVSPNSVRLMADDGTSYIDFGPSGVVTIKASAVNFVGMGAGICNVTTTGNVVAGQGTGDSVTLQQHKHPTAATGAPSVPTPGT